MSFFKRETLIEWLARESGWLLTDREADFYQVRLERDSGMRYVKIRSRDQNDTVLFQTHLPVQFPISAVPPELFKHFLLRNRLLAFGSWTFDVRDSCDTVFYLTYIALKAGLTPSMFNTICRELLKEREAVHDELRGQFGRVNMPVRLTVQPTMTGTRLAAGGGQQGIVWVQG